MEFSVLMSVYVKENPEFLRAALDSLLNQTVVPNQIVIVKDGPLTKALDHLIEEYQSNFATLFYIVSLKENKGLGIALQKGLEACKFPLVARMDGDDICASNRFEKQLQIFQSDKNLDLVGSSIQEFEGDITNIISNRKVPSTHEEIRKFAKKRNPFNHMTVMYKKKAVLEAGNYQDFLWNEDYYLWIRMLLSGARCANLSEPLVFARTGVEMFGRRGGLKYAKVEFKLQCYLLSKKFINLWEFLRNITIRMTTRLVPNSLRKIIYLRLIHK